MTSTDNDYVIVKIFFNLCRAKYCLLKRKEHTYTNFTLTESAM